MLNKGYTFIQSSIRLVKKNESVENKDFVLEMGVKIVKNKKQQFDKAVIIYTFMIRPAKNCNYEILVILRSDLEFKGSDIEEKERILRHEAPLLHFEVAKLEFDSLLYKVFKENIPVYELDVFELLENEEKDGTLYFPEEFFKNFE